MDKNGKTGRRYSAEEKAAAVRMVRTLGLSWKPIEEQRNGLPCNLVMGLNQ
jgi:hypothetical protein